MKALNETGMKFQDMQLNSMTLAGVGVRLFHV
jgi:hypothetical protein